MLCIDINILYWMGLSVSYANIHLNQLPRFQTLKPFIIVCCMTSYWQLYHPNTMTNHLHIKMCLNLNMLFIQLNSFTPNFVEDAWKPHYFFHHTIGFDSTSVVEIVGNKVQQHHNNQQTIYRQITISIGTCCKKPIHSPLYLSLSR